MLKSFQLETFPFKHFGTMIDLFRTSEFPITIV